MRQSRLRAHPVRAASSRGLGVVRESHRNGARATRESQTYVQAARGEADPCMTDEVAKEKQKKLREAQLTGRKGGLRFRSSTAIISRQRHSDWSTAPPLFAANNGKLGGHASRGCNAAVWWCACPVDRYHLKCRACLLACTQNLEDGRNPLRR